MNLQLMADTGAGGGSPSQTDGGTNTDTGAGEGSNAGASENNTPSFDDVLGQNRAYKAAQKAKKLALKPNYGIDPLDYDGSIERSKMGTMTKEEEAAYLKARVLYLEKVVEFQKKFHRYWNRTVYLTSPRISY